MNGLQFRYATTEEITSSLHNFSSLGIFEGVVLVGVIFFVLLSIFFVIPFFLAGESYIFSEREKRKKRSMLKQIMTQKEIEDEVEKEIEQDELNRQAKQK